MLRFTFYLFIAVFLFFSTQSNATIISSDDYIQYDSDGDGVANFDIIWASSFAFQFYGCTATISNRENYYADVYGSAAGEDIECANQLLAPEFVMNGWMFAEQVSGIDIGDISTLFASGEFENNGVYINGFSYWNTDADAIVSVNPFNLNVISDWRSLNPFGNPFGFNFDQRLFSNVFYVRESLPVPEPSTLIVFVLGIIGLSMRKKA